MSIEMMKELLNMGWVVFATGFIACGGATASPASPDPSPVSNVTVPADPPPASNVVEAPAAPEGEESEAATNPSPLPLETEEPAQPTPPQATIMEARNLFQLGVAAFQQGRYEDARDAFQAAHQMVPKPQVLYNLAMTEMKLGHVQVACKYLEAWVKETSPSPSRLQSMATELQKCGIMP